MKKSIASANSAKRPKIPFLFLPVPIVHRGLLKFNNFFAFDAF